MVLGAEVLQEEDKVEEELAVEKEVLEEELAVEEEAALGQVLLVKEQNSLESLSR